MAASPAGKRRFGSIILSVACIGVAAAVGWSVLGKRAESQASAAPGEVTGSIETETARPMGPSGLPIPRFVSLKAEKVNVRRGPSSDHPVAWVFQRKGLPVEIVAEFDNWRRIRDAEGAEGWVLHSLLSGRRSAIVAPWRKGETHELRESGEAGATIVARLESGVIVSVRRCDKSFCRVRGPNFDGFIDQKLLWGVYSNEKID